MVTEEMLESPAFQYAAAVERGDVICGNKIKLAVKRFKTWIEEAEEKGFFLDHKAGEFALSFFPKFLNHTVGKLVGQPFELAPFQAFTIYNLFAWKYKSSKLRRIKTVYDKRAKKNGKTAEMAGLSLYMMSFDYESSAQIYIGATKEEQAKLCWEQAKQFIDSFAANPLLRNLGFRCLQNKILFDPTNSIMKPLGGDSKTQDGINTHFGVIDEYHAHATDGVKENIESSMMMRSQPILYQITTAGFNTSGVCKLYEDAVTEVLEGRVEDDTLWVMIHDMDEGDDWEDEISWKKANPLLECGVMSIDRFREDYIKAKNQPSKIPNFKTKNLNIWEEHENPFIDLKFWKANKSSEFSLDKFKKFGCYGGLDLSSTTDFTALVFVSNPDENDNRYVLPFLFVPEYTVRERSKEDRVPYDYWVNKGFIIATPGNRVDYKIVKKYVVDYYFLLNCERIEADPHNLTAMENELEGTDVILSRFPQHITNMSHPTKIFEIMVLDGKLKHNGNPVMEWMLSGCTAYSDANENIKLLKNKTKGKRIDGIIATINAIAGQLTGPNDENGDVSIYADPNVPFIC